jgi:cytochrome c biogenesis protein CcmG/thiol:disulfide interchange protein DsbE
MSRTLRFAPLILVALLVAGFIWKLETPSDTNITSKMIGKNLAAVHAPPALAERPGVWIGDPAAGPRVINFFASWCVPCIAEAPALARMKAEGIPIEGIAVRDRPGEVAAFLQANGDPYRGIGLDRNSEIQMQFGASGVPETFIVDGKGVIRYQHIGPLEPDDIAAIRAQWAGLRR